MPYKSWLGLARVKAAYEIVQIGRSKTAVIRQHDQRNVLQVETLQPLAKFLRLFFWRFVHIQNGEPGSSEYPAGKNAAHRIPPAARSFPAIQL